MIAPTKPAFPGPAACKICGGDAAPYGTVDFNKSCEENRGFRLPPSGVPIQYRRCAACGFLFTDAFDDWDDAQFVAHIYNDDYQVVDPDYQVLRPSENAKLIEHFFSRDKAKLHVLDYGVETTSFVPLSGPRVSRRRSPTIRWCPNLCGAPRGVSI